MGVSNIIRMIGDYKVSNDERTLFDWLIIKQKDFGIDKPFRHSIPQVQAATNIARHSQEKIIKKFTDLKFLKIGIEFFQNNPYRTYYVDFSILSEYYVLSQIIKPDTYSFKEVMDYIKEMSKAQENKTKPLSKNKQKQLAKEEEMAKQGADNLYVMLCQKWKSRVEMYNRGELTSNKIPNRSKIASQLPIGKNGKQMLMKLRKQYDDSTICNGFVAYADKCLLEEIKPNNIILYFLKYEDGCFEVVNDMVNYHMMNYGYKSQ